MFKFFKSKEKPKKPLIVLGTDFGSYQFFQLVEASDEYQVVGFISDDSWQQKSSFAKVGVFPSSQLQALCEQQDIAAIVLPSDQKEIWLKAENADSGDNEQDLLQGVESKVKHCDVLTIQSNATTEQANHFLANLIAD